MVQLSSKEVRQKLTKIEGWKMYRSKSVQRKFRLKDFNSAVAFVNRLASIANDANHHPDIVLQNYSEVIVRTMTHSVGGITNKDFDLAKKINKEYDSFKE